MIFAVSVMSKTIRFLKLVVHVEDHKVSGTPKNMRLFHSALTSNVPTIVASWVVSVMH